MLERLHDWHQTRVGLAVFALIEFGLAYVFGSLAVDRGQFLFYALAILFLFGGVQNTIKLIGRLLSGNRQAGKTG